MTIQDVGSKINGSNTYVSLALLITVLAGFWMVLSNIYSYKSENSVNQYRIENKVDALTGRVDKFEAAQETWSFQDMFKWAVHLQRDNPSMKIPEPTDKK